MIEYSQRGGMAGIDRRMTAEGNGEVTLSYGRGKRITATVPTELVERARAELDALPRSRGGLLKRSGGRLLSLIGGHSDGLRVELRFEGERIADPTGPEAQAAIEALDRIDVAARHQRGGS